MRSPLVPPHEALRQYTLDSLGVLDTPPEGFSDAVASAAAAIANVPISAISLVDADRQWFKASCGLAASETSRDVSFCAHAILGVEPFIVPDALLDPTFRDNPLVIGAPFIRSYAGFPLIVDGQVVGSLCVIDQRPRKFTPEQLACLRQLASATVIWMMDRQHLTDSLSTSQLDLRRARFFDHVTGLPNKRAVTQALQIAARHCDSVGSSLAVLFVDIDGFKPMSDGWEDERTDGALRGVADILLRAVKPSDMVARVGHDQFIVLLADSNDVSAAKLAVDIGAALRSTVSTDGSVCSLTAAMGIALYTSSGVAARVIANADSAMVAVKRAGGNGFRFFDAKLDADTHERVALVDGLRAAVQNSELELYYQPKIHALSGRITGVEALLRWHHPERGMVSPAIFIPLAEQCGLINEIGSWVIGQACRQMQAWNAAGSNMRVAINLSVHQLMRVGIAEEIAATLRLWGVDAKLLTCEVTESVAMNDVAPALDVFQRLKATGIQLSIDDFGTGFSSLSYLRKLPVHQLKIDRSFVTDIGENEDARSVVAAIINLAHALRLEVVAEGVETSTQREILLKMGCDKFQGFLFARPMSAKAFTAVLQAAARNSAFCSSIFAEV